MSAHTLSSSLLKSVTNFFVKVITSMHYIYIFNCPLDDHSLTGGTVVHQGSQGLAVPPVLVEVVDGKLRHFVLDPSQKPLLGCELLGVLVILIIPHGHGDGVVEDEGPDQTQNELQVPIHNGLAVCDTKERDTQELLALLMILLHNRR